MIHRDTFLFLRTSAVSINAMHQYVDILSRNVAFLETSLDFLYFLLLLNLLPLSM